MLNLPSTFRNASGSVIGSGSLCNPDTDVLPPNELGLPSRYDKWRPNQYEAVERILASDKRFIVICAATGFGKSLCAMAAAVMSGRRTVILTSTKGLMDQIGTEFTDMVADIRGLANYPCPIAAQFGLPPSTTVADAPCQCGYGCKLKHIGNCEYYDRYRAAQKSDVVVTNYQCWMYDTMKTSEERGNLQFGSSADTGIMGTGKETSVGMLVMDEVHDAGSEISRFIGIDLSRKECLNLHLPWPDAGRTVDDWRMWAAEWIGDVSERAKDIEARLRSGESGQWSKELKHLRDIKRKLERLSGMSAEDEWIITESEVNSESGTMSAVRFDPLSPARYAESALFRGIEKIVLVSATVRPKTAAMLGIDPSEMEFVEYPSTFPVERRPVIHIPSIRMTFKNEQDDELMAEWLRIFDDIVGSRLALGWKGIAHCVSYRRAKFIADNSKHRSHMLIHSAFDRSRVIEEYKRCSGARLLLSPSISTGYDFLGNLCRFQIITKLPFGTVSDPVVKARKAKDPDYDLYRTAQTLVQMSGRAVRSESDFAETWILDDSLAWAYPRMKSKGFLPTWWVRSFRSVDEAPPPIEFEKE